MTHAELLALLAELNIGYERFDHPPVRTCEEADEVVPMLDGVARTKNLFLRDRRGRRHFMIVLATEQMADLDELEGILQANRLSFASAERLREYLGVESGALSLLAMANDPERRVELAVAKKVWESPQIFCHALINTVTLALPMAGMRQFLARTGHEPRIL